MKNPKKEKTQIEKEFIKRNKEHLKRGIKSFVIISMDNEGNSLVNMVGGTDTFCTLVMHAFSRIIAQMNNMGTPQK